MRYWCVFIILLICGSVAADDFMYTKAGYTAQMRRKLGYAQSNIGALPDADAEAFIEEGVAFAMPLVRASKQIRMVVTSYQVNDYALDSTTLGVISVWWKSGSYFKALQHLPISEWDKVEHKTTSGQSDTLLKRPSYYDFSDSVLSLYPVPSVSGDTIRILSWNDIGNVVALDTLKAIPQQYRIVVLNYATWAAALSRSDVRAQGFYEALVSSVGALNSALNRIESK
jgi:hypothetical protein